MEKQFMCFWNGKHYDQEKSELKTLDFFSESNGYFPEDIQQLIKLEVGKSYSPEDGQIITRVN